MKIFAAILSIFFVMTGSLEARSTKDHKIYVDPSSIRIQESQILLVKKNRAIPVSGIGTDSKGVYVLRSSVQREKMQRLRQCRNCGLTYFPASEWSRCPRCGKV